MSRGTDAAETPGFPQQLADFIAASIEPRHGCRGNTFEAFVQTLGFTALQLSRGTDAAETDWDEMACKTILKLQLSRGTDAAETPRGVRRWRAGARFN